MSKKSALLEGERCDSELCEVRQSGIHGRGLFATAKIEPETYIIEYIGERIDKDESNERGWQQFDIAKETGEAAVYIFTLDDDWDIDGNVPENAARLMNHSCDPNCEAFIEDDKIWIAALRTIEKDEELFFNYGFDLENYKSHPCYCGTERCVGYIAGEDYWSKLKKKLKKAKKKKAKRKVAKK
ncbi:MAG: SET domain-containing protein-lysine N-methyltransferase [Verrucomicrobiales bacterium]|nr:SET domain-containing protein-lysine N-methyltransferase [Verrucomicrobiales bacterium]